jgi:hypothetical protein
LIIRWIKPRVAKYLDKKGSDNDDDNKYKQERDMAEEQLLKLRAKVGKTLQKLQKQKVKGACSSDSDQNEEIGRDKQAGDSKLSMKAYGGGGSGYSGGSRLGHYNPSLAVKEMHAKENKASLTQRKALQDKLPVSYRKWFNNRVATYLDVLTHEPIATPTAQL